MVADIQVIKSFNQSFTRFIVLCESVNSNVWSEWVDHLQPTKFNEPTNIRIIYFVGNLFMLNLL